MRRRRGAERARASISTCRWSAAPPSSPIALRSTPPSQRIADFAPEMLGAGGRTRHRGRRSLPGLRHRDAGVRRDRTGTSRSCGLPMLVVQEGGYPSPSLGANLASLLTGLGCMSLAIRAMRDDEADAGGRHGAWPRRAHRNGLRAALTGAILAGRARPDRRDGGRGWRTLHRRLPRPHDLLHLARRARPLRRRSLRDCRRPAAATSAGTSCAARPASSQLAERASSSWKWTRPIPAPSASTRGWASARRREDRLHILEQDELQDFISMGDDT